MPRQSPARPRAPLPPLMALAALCVPLCVGLTACESDQKPAPTKVDESKVDARKRPAQKPPVENTGYKRPDLHPPKDIDGPQLADEEVEKFLAQGAEALEAKDQTNAMGNFRRCANREPASARCDGELGLVLARQKRRRVAAQYYLMRAGANDDPKANADLYARVGDALRKFGKWEESAAAWSLAIAREDKAEYHAGRAAPLMSSKAKGGAALIEAADELAKAHAMQPNEMWAYEEGNLRGQSADAEQMDRGMELLQKLADETKDEAMKKRALEAKELIRQNKLLKARGEQLQAEGKLPTPAASAAPEKAPAPQ